MALIIPSVVVPRRYGYHLPVVQLEIERKKIRGRVSKRRGTLIVHGIVTRVILVSVIFSMYPIMFQFMSITSTKYG
jgi:hypothetical protein